VYTTDKYSVSMKPFNWPQISVKYMTLKIITGSGVFQQFSNCGTATSWVTRTTLTHNCATKKETHLIPHTFS
jgi:hypothetical protein